MRGLCVEKDTQKINNLRIRKQLYTIMLWCEFCSSVFKDCSCKCYNKSPLTGATWCSYPQITLVVFDGLLFAQSLVFSSGPLWRSGLSSYYCSQSTLRLWVQTMLMQVHPTVILIDYDCQFSCRRSVVFSGHSGFLHQ